MGRGSTEEHLPCVGRALDSTPELENKYFMRYHVCLLKGGKLLIGGKLVSAWQGMKRDTQARLLGRQMALPLSKTV